jgi:hypothetical protein
MSDGVGYIIDGLTKLANAPRNEWLAIAHQIEAAPRVLTADAGIQAVNVCSAAKILAPTFAYLTEASEQEARGMATALAAMLANERAVHGGKARPHYLRGDR